MASRSRTRGFSLLEALATTALIMTLAALAVPRFGLMRAPYAADSAARMVRADLQVARLQAIASNVRFRINFTSSGYTIERETAPGVFTANAALVKLPTGVTLSAPNPSNPIFDTRGMLVGNVTFTVTTPHATTRTVTINVLGKATIT